MKNLLTRFIVCLLVFTFTSASLEAQSKCRNTARKLGKIGLGLVVIPPTSFGIIEQFRKDSNSVETGDFESENVGRGAVQMSNYGDSLSTGFHVDSEWKSLDQMRTLRTTGSAFCEPKPSSGITSVFRRVADDKIPVKAVTHARVGAAAIRFRPLNRWAKFASTMRDLDEQVDEALSESTFSNLHLIWMGHNDLNWISDTLQFGLDETAHLKRLPELFYSHVELQVERLIRKAREVKRKTAIILLGLADIESSMKVHEEIEERKKKEPNIYPKSDRLYACFPAMIKNYLKETIVLQRDYNLKLRELVKKLTDSYKDGLIKVLYSDSINRLNAKAELLNEVDAFHLSNAGRNEIAEAVYKSGEFQDAMKFVR